LQQLQVLCSCLSGPGSSTCLQDKVQEVADQAKLAGQYAASCLACLLVMRRTCNLYAASCCPAAVLRT
jgi:galactitol-specific phosphotransferase system IIB component